MTKKKINLTHINHHNAKRMEFFLNALNDELKEVSFNWNEMKMADLVSAACKFISNTNQPSLTITVYFCNSYFEATEFAQSNHLSNTSNERWSINGDLLYLVKTEDEEKLIDILGLFAGEE